MALLQKLKSLLGLTDSSTQRGGQRDVGVTVEHEGEDEPATATENAVKGAEAGGEPVAAGTDAAASTGSMTDTSAETAAEPAEAAGPTTDEDVESEESADHTEETTDEATESAAGTDEDVQVIKGIGPAYADRLAAVGIETVADLAAADAIEVAAETDLSEKRVGQWIERAKVR